MTLVDDAQKLVFRHLTKRVALDKDTVTYRILSRELGITVQQSKTYLKEFYQDPQTVARGVAATWILTGLLAPLENDIDAMEIDGGDEKGKGKARANSEGVRGILLVQDSERQVQSLQFISPPSAHIYSLSPGLLPDLSLLTGYDLPSAPAATAPKWKDAPATGYGGIHHPKGDRKPVATNSSDPKAKKSIAPAVQAKKPIASTSTSTQSSLGATKATTTKAKGGKTEPSKPPAKVFRPIGSLGGLFAKSIPEPKPKKHESPAPESPVPAKKGKTTKQKPKVESDEDEEWNEAELEEMRVMEVEAKKKASEKNREALAAKKKAMEEKKKKAAMNMAASTSTVTSAKPSASASASASASTSGKESAAEKQKKILEEMMNVEEPNVKMELDDEGDVVVAPKKRMLKPSK